ncbi:MAG TPA: hypothetical protein VL147_20630 [Devosia sp.]|nr:hypothetical protein [Devosia sp.]
MADAVVQQFANVGQQIADAFLAIDWVGIGVSLMNAIWEGMKSIIPNMVNGLGAAIQGLNPFGGGAPQANPLADPDPNALPVPGWDAAKAAGGSIVGGKTYLVGEEGPELITPGGSGWVHTARETAGMLGGRPQSAGLTLHLGGVSISGVSDPEQAYQMIKERLAAELRDALGGIYADIEYAG